MRLSDDEKESREAWSNLANEIDLFELWKIIWSGRRLIVGVSAIFLIAAVVVSTNMPNIYRSQVLLAPASGGESGALFGLRSQFGGLASLAGVDIGGTGGIDKPTLALEVLKSREFIIRFAKENDLAIPLLAAKGWSAANERWIINDDIYDIEQKKWNRYTSKTKATEPSALEIYRRFSESLTITKEKDTGLVRISLSLMSPLAAKRWLESLIDSLNDYMRASDIQDAERSIAYLKNQLKKTSVAEMQSIFYQLIEQQTKTIMLAEVRKEYVFKTVDPPVVPDEVFKPSRPVICILSAILGAIVGLIAVFVRWIIANRSL